MITMTQKVNTLVVTILAVSSLITAQTPSPKNNIGQEKKIHSIANIQLNIKRPSRPTTSFKIPTTLIPANTPISTLKPKRNTIQKNTIKHTNNNKINNKINNHKMNSIIKLSNKLPTVDNTLSDEKSKAHHHHHKDRPRKQKKKMNDAMMALLLAYKLKFAALIPTMVMGLLLLLGTTALAGFFFALFAAILGLKGH